MNPHCAIDYSNPTDTINNKSSIVYSQNYIYYASWAKLFQIKSWNTWPITSYITSLVITWGDIHKLKAINEIDLKFSWTSAECYIQLQAQVQENWTWITLRQWKNSDISKINHWLRIYSNMFLNPLWEFNTIRFKVNFIASNWTYSCSFYWLDLFGNIDVWTR